MGIDIPEKMAAIEQNALECSESRMLIHKRIAEESPKWSRAERPESGDLVTIMIRPPYVNHLGVVVGGGRFIHILNKTQVVIERLSDPVWKIRIAGFYRWPINGNGDGER
jgi:cell wall-associated NlpC family hydrolase